MAVNWAITQRISVGGEMGKNTFLFSARLYLIYFWFLLLSILVPSEARSWYPMLDLYSDQSTPYFSDLFQIELDVFYCIPTFISVTVMRQSSDKDHYYVYLQITQLPVSVGEEWHVNFFLKLHWLVFHLATGFRMSLPHRSVG